MAAPARPELDLPHVVSRAAFLDERGLHCNADDGRPEPPVDPSVQRRLARWAAVLAPVHTETGEHALLKRWSWDGIDPRAVRRALADDWHPPAGPLPAWAETLAELVEACRQPVDAGCAVPASTTPLPFDALYAPMEAWAIARLQSRWPDAGDASPWSLLSLTAREQLVQLLRARLSACAGRALQQAFEQHIPLGERLLNRISPSHNAGCTQRYQAFVASVQGDGWAGIFNHWPVVARLLVTVLDLWVDGTAEMLDRLEADRPALQRVYGDAAPLGRVAGIRMSLSDAHHGHRGTAVLSFEDGTRIVYKPKSLALDMAYNDLLAWCNRTGAPLAMKVLQVIDRVAYGWCEYVEHAPCDAPDAVARFYERAGILLCLVHLLRGTDAHCDNLIANGEWPVLIDTETLLHPEPMPMQSSADEPAPAGSERLYDSVFRTGLLPHWVFSADERSAIDISGFGSQAEDISPRMRETWDAINTDAMRLRLLPVLPPARANAPHLDGRQMASTVHRASVERGFSRMYEFLSGRASELQSGRGPLAAMRALPVRYIFRATRIYSNALGLALDPQALRNGADFGIELERLGCAFLLARERPAAWPIRAAECSALHRLDFPHFTSTTDSHVLHLGADASIEGYFRAASCDEMRELLATWGPGDFQFQAAVVRGCFDAQVAHSEDKQLVAADAPVPELPAPDANTLLDSAQRIAEELLVKALPGPEGVDWLGMSYVHTADRFQLHVSGDDLYEGRAGIALFLAAMSAVRPDERLRAGVRAALVRLCQRIDGSSQEALETMAQLQGVGGATGIGSHIYALTRVGVFLGEAGYVQLATRLAGAITPGVIACDRRLDVVAGSAGALLSLLALHRVTGDAQVLTRARDCGEHLLLRRVAARGGPRAWVTGNGLPQTGFAHGAAGICLALDRLAQATVDSRYAMAAAEGIEFERLESDARVSAADPMPDRASLVQWCHGATGTALARLGAGAARRTERDRREIEAALAVTAGAGLARRDHLCCGNGGRIDALLEGGRAFGNSRWHDAALARAAAVLARARSAGAYHLTAHEGAPVFNPGLFQGAAGIGYQWLRLACSGMPSVLLWQ